MLLQIISINLVDVIVGHGPEDGQWVYRGGS